MRGFSVFVPAVVVVEAIVGGVVVDDDGNEASGTRHSFKPFEMFFANIPFGNRSNHRVINVTNNLGGLKSNHSVEE